jgi:hypothetical protein
MKRRTETKGREKGGHPGLATTNHSYRECTRIDANKHLGFEPYYGPSSASLNGDPPLVLRIMMLFRLFAWIRVYSWLKAASTQLSDVLGGGDGRFNILPERRNNTGINRVGFWRGKDFICTTHLQTVG